MSVKSSCLHDDRCIAEVLNCTNVPITLMFICRKCDRMVERMTQNDTATKKRFYPVGMCYLDLSKTIKTIHNFNNIPSFYVSQDDCVAARDVKSR